MERQTKKPTIQSVEIVPEDSLALPKQGAKPTSKNPAIMSKIQFILWFNNQNRRNIRKPFNLIIDKLFPSFDTYNYQILLK